MVKHLEKEIQLSICQYLEMKHYFFWRQNTTPVFDFKNKMYRPMPKYSLNGVPDIILINKGIFIGLEVKQPKGKQSDSQRLFELACKKAGGRYHIITSIDDVQALGL